MRAYFWGAGWVLATGRGMAGEVVHGVYSFCCERVAKNMAGVVPALSFEYTTAAQSGGASYAQVRSRRRRPARGFAARPRSACLAGRGGVAGDGKGRQGIGADAPLLIPLRLAFAGGAGCLHRLGVAWGNRVLPPLLQCCLSLKLTPMGASP
jgi:hypothetical protein